MIRRLISDARGWAAAVGLAGAMLCPAVPARASMTTTVSSPSPLNLAIPDGAYNGTLASMVSDSLTVGPLSNPITNVSVTVGIDHPFVGDLTIKLEGPTGQLVTLVSRAGMPGQPDTGAGAGGDSSQLSAAFPITFEDDAPSSVLSLDMGMGIKGYQVIGDPANGSPNNYVPFANGAGIGSLSAFNGTLATGVWTLYVGDSAPEAVGTLDSFSLTITTPAIPTIPEPATAVCLIALAWPLLGRRARRRG